MGHPHHYAFDVNVYVLRLFLNNSEFSRLNRSKYFFILFLLQWMHKPLLEGRLSMNCDPLGSSVKLCGTTKLPGHLCTSALLSKMVLLQLKNSVALGNDDAERRKIDNISKLQW